MNFDLFCPGCQNPYPLAPEMTVCPACSSGQQAGQPLAGVLEVRLHPEPGEAERLVAAGLAGLDILSLLPAGKEHFPAAPVGSTPLWAPERLRREFGFPGLFIKDEGANPTGSLKDRASLLVAAFARQHGIRRITAASTGNAGSSMAGIGAAAGLEVTLFLPKTAPRAKMVQSLQYGARLVLVDGNYDRAYDLSLAYTRREGGMSRNTAYNPMTVEGKKTVSLEIARQLGGAPDAVFVSVGDGVILSGVFKGFADLLRLGLIGKMPTVWAVQAEGSSAIRRAFESGRFGEPVASHTVADSISVDVPRGGIPALRGLQAFGGRCLAVSDEAILEAQRLLASRAGLFTEPAGAAAMAGFLAARPQLDPQARVVVLATGNGLKDIDSAARTILFPERPVRTLEEIP